MTEILVIIASIEWIALGALVFVKLRKLYKQINEYLIELEKEVMKSNL